MAFSKDFLWCAVTAACRIEGAFLQYEKGLSIWDVDFMDRIKHGETAHEAADYYNRWKEDVDIMKEIWLKSYRFSISWARIFPDASGSVNEKSLIFLSKSRP